MSKMEAIESEEPLMYLSENIAQLLDNIADIGAKINEKSTNLLCDINRTNYPDVNGIENIGLGMIKILKTMNINVVDITNLLQRHLEQVNENRNEKLFQVLLRDILECKKSLATIDSINSTSKSTDVSDNWTQTDWSDCRDSGVPETKNEEIKAEVEMSAVENIKLKDIHLGLIRTDTQDTDDGWVDSINRSPTALELWNRKYEGEKINITDEYLNELKKEVGEESDGNTEDINIEVDKNLPSGGDTLRGEQSTKENKVDNLKPGPKSEVSITIEEHKLPDVLNPTHQMETCVSPEANSVDNDTRLDTEINSKTESNIEASVETNFSEASDDTEPPICDQESDEIDESVGFPQSSDEATINKDLVLDTENPSEDVRDGIVSEDTQVHVEALDSAIISSQVPTEVHSEQVVPGDSLYNVDIEENCSDAKHRESDTDNFDRLDEDLLTSMRELNDCLGSVTPLNVQMDNTDDLNQETELGSIDCNDGQQNQEKDDESDVEQQILNKNVEPDCDQDDLEKKDKSGCLEQVSGSKDESHIREQISDNKSESDCGQQISENSDESDIGQQISEKINESDYRQHILKSDEADILEKKNKSDCVQLISEGKHKLAIDQQILEKTDESDNVQQISDKKDDESDCSQQITEKNDETDIAQQILHKENGMNCGQQISEKNYSDCGQQVSEKTYQSDNGQQVLDENQELDIEQQILEKKDDSSNTTKTDNKVSTSLSTSPDPVPGIDFIESESHSGNETVDGSSEQKSFKKLNSNIDQSNDKNNEGNSIETTWSQETIILNDFIGDDLLSEKSPNSDETNINEETEELLENAPSKSRVILDDNDNEGNVPSLLENENGLSSTKDADKNALAANATSDENLVQSEADCNNTYVDELKLLSQEKVISGNIPDSIERDTVVEKEPKQILNQSKIINKLIFTDSIDSSIRIQANEDISESETFDESCNKANVTEGTNKDLATSEDNCLTQSTTISVDKSNYGEILVDEEAGRIKTTATDELSVLAEDCVNSSGNLLDSQEFLSQGSSNSFVFDISKNFNNIGQDPLESKNPLSLNADPKLMEKENNSPKEGDEPIEIYSDSDEDVQLDVTMEEIVSTGSPINVENLNNKLDAKNFSDVKIEKTEKVEIIDCPPVSDDVNKAQDFNESTSHQTIGDEILKLIREVEIKSTSPIKNNVKNSSKTCEKNDSEKANEIFKMLQEESASEISDTDSTDESCTDIEAIGKICNDKPICTKNEEQSQSNLKEPPPNIRDCYVSIERLQLEPHEVIKLSKTLNVNIDRLCDINSIISKRRHGDAQEKSKSKKIRKSLVSKTGTSDSESLSDFSFSDSDDPPSDNTPFSTTITPLEQKIDDMLANEICKVLKNTSSSDESTDVDSDDSDKTSKKAMNGGNGKTECNDVHEKHKMLSREERKKKAWKNDPLLRGKLNSDESSDSSSSSWDSEKSRKKRKALRHKYEYDSDSTETENDSDNLHVSQYQIEEKSISPTKGNIELSDSSSDTGSDIEIVIPKQVTPQKDPDDEERELGVNSSQKGRRNIRALMADENLTEATQKANKEEEERIERLKDRQKMKKCLSQSFSQPIEEDMLVLDMDEVTGEPLVTVHPGLIERLKPHQRSGVQFMWDSCYESLVRVKKDPGSGCILAHCMGLGKTFQVLTLLHTLFSYPETNTKHVLVVCPLSTVNNWRKEVRIAFKNVEDNKLNVYTIAEKMELSQKYEIVKRWKFRSKGVLVLGYEAFETITNDTKLEKIDGFLRKLILEALINPGPDLVICDEGHLLRNKKALKTLALNRIKTQRRIVLTGTPLQNNLLEYYYMVDFVKPNLLGNMKEFKTNFVNPITNGQYEDSTAEDIKLMMKRTHVLHVLLKKTIQRVEDTELKIYLPKMIDHAVFIQLHQVQVELYNKFAQIIEINSYNTNRKGFLSDFCIFQYICSHPHLLSVMESLRSKKIKERDLITNEREDNPICNIDGWWKAVIPPDAAERIEYGNKIKVLRSIIEECEEIGDKVLVFSQSLGELDLIEHFLKKEGTAKCHSWTKKIDYSRMDGTVPPAHRTTICDLFNDKNNKKLRLLLMSTRVGGLGLNLTAANRVIIMTVNWNPSYDIQSIFRVYRFGQEKEVYVYRLIALDSMEEKVYQRTVTKLAIAHRVVDKHQITRHYKSVELQELYSCKPDADIARPKYNVPEDTVLAKLMTKLPCIFKHHEHRALLANRPEDNLNEQELKAACDEFKRNIVAPQVPPPPPPQQPVPQTSALASALAAAPNGPTFSMAYDLTRPSTLTNNIQKKGGVTNNDKDPENIPQYFIPKSSSVYDPTSKTTNQTTKTSDTRSHSPTVVSTDRNTLQRDPLYIPPSKELGKANKSYSERLKAIQKRYLLTKVPPSATIVLDEFPDKSNEKENHESHRERPFFDVSKQGDGSIIILDEDPNRSTPTSGSASAINPKPLLKLNPVGIKRRKTKEDTSTILKKMRIEFNNRNNHITPISIDDDDVSVVSNTTSETGSLSNELINNLGRSGITISKVMSNTMKKTDDVITLD